jgi:hypothetical protein
MVLRFAKARRLIPFAAAIVLSLVSSPEAFACMCFSEPLCKALPSQLGHSAIFVGRVTELYPASITAYNANPQQIVGSNKPKLSIIWHSELSPEQLSALQAATSEAEIDKASDLPIIPQRVRFEVQEWLEGGPARELVLYTSFSSCGYRFKMGETYLVVADKESPKLRWRTGACTGTQPILTAGEDLKALRPWKEGRLLPPRVYGQIQEERPQPLGPPIYTPMPGLPVLLFHGESKLEVRSDHAGRFSFDDLAQSKYRLELGQPGWQGSKEEVDLTRDRCFELDVIVQKGKAVTSVTILGNIPSRAPD